MGLESIQKRLMDDNRLDMPLYKTAAYSMKVGDLVVHYDTTAGAMAVTLPPVAAAKGKIYSIMLDTDGGDLTIQDIDDSVSWSDLTCDDAGDGFLLYSDGQIWWQLGATTP